MSTTARPAPRRALQRARLLGLALTVTLVAAPASSADARAAASAHQAAAISAAGNDDGRRSFGIRPSGPKKPDARPTWTYQNLKPGQQVFDHVAVVNISTKPALLDVYPADAFNTAAGGFDVLPEKKASTDLGTWVHLTRKRVQVPARSTLIMPFSLTVPKNAEPGDHAAGIVASLKTLAKDRKGNAVTVDQRVGARLYVRVAGALTPRLEIVRESGAFAAGGLLSRGTTTMRYSVRNTGNVRLVGVQTIRVNNLFGGSTVAKGTPELAELLPGNSVDFTVPVKRVLPAFLLAGRVTVDPRSVTGNVDPALSQATARTWIWAVPWLILALLLLVIAYGGYRGWRWYRARQATKPKPAPTTEKTGRKTPSKDGALVTRVSPVAIAIAIILGVAVGVVVGGTAHATPRTVLAAAPVSESVTRGSLTFIPGTGRDTTPMYAVTSGGCPQAATNVVGMLYGKGFPAQGVVVVSNNDTSTYHAGSFGVPPQDTLAAFAMQAGIKLQGAYRLALKCTDQFAMKTYAEFSGTITFSDHTHYTAPVPKTPPDQGVPVGYLALVFPEYRKVVAAQATAGFQEAEAGRKEAAAAKKLGPSAAAAAPSQAAAPVTSASSFVQSAITPFLVILAVVAGLGVVGFAWTRRPVRTAGKKTTVTWPDEGPR